MWQGVYKWPFSVVADAMEVIPRTLAQNCGADVVRRLTELRAKHATGKSTWVCPAFSCRRTYNWVGMLHNMYIPGIVSVSQT